MHGLPREVQAKLDELARLKKLNELNPRYDMLFGSAANNPFDPPRHMPSHAASVVNLALLIQTKRKQPQVIAEVGVWQGYLSRWLLTCLPYATLHMIDPWRTADPASTWYRKGDRYAKFPQEQFDAYHSLCSMLAEQFAPRVVIHRQPSLEAVHDFEDGSLDVVFIDGAHDGENVRNDILAWRPKVRSDGYLSGHDYHTGGNYFGLVAAVEKTTAELGLAFDVFPGKVWAAKIPSP